MIVITTIDIAAKENEIEKFEAEVSNYLFKGYNLICKTNTYAKLYFDLVDM